MILNIFMTTIQYVRICCIVVYWIIEGSIIIRWCSAVQAHPVWHASSSWIPASALTLNFPPWMLYLNMTFNWTSVNWKRSWWPSCLIFRRLLPTFIFKFRLILKSRAWNPCYSTGCPQKEKFVIIFCSISEVQFCSVFHKLSLSFFPNYPFQTEPITNYAKYLRQSKNFIHPFLRDVLYFFNFKM